MIPRHDYWGSLITELLKLPRETGWVEFKHNKADPQEIGEYLSALSNTAALKGKAKAYLIWGVEDGTHAVLGTHFEPAGTKVGNQELESWLLQQLNPKLNFAFHAVMHGERPLVVLEVDAAFRHPVQFQGAEWVRVGSYKKRLREFAEMERELWRTLDRTPFEWLVAAEKLAAPDVLSLLDYPAYFSLMKLPLPDGHQALLSALAADRLVERMDSGHWRIFNLGALLFARRLADFGRLGRKALRLVRYQGNDRLAAHPETAFPQGYAMAYELVIQTLHGWLPGNEVIGKALRRDVRMYPDIAIRELVANALIHQDLAIAGTSPLIELYDDRLEVSNPGVPLVDTQRLLDTPPRSRNEAMASMMRRMDVCEERGTRVVHQQHDGAQALWDCRRQQRHGDPSAQRGGSGQRYSRSRPDRRTQTEAVRALVGLTATCLVLDWPRSRRHDQSETQDLSHYISTTYQGITSTRRT